MKILLQKKFYTDDVSPLLKLALPLIFSGVVESSIGFFSTIFLSHLGQKELAAGSLVAWMFATLMVILWGALTAVSVLVSQKHGEKNDKGVSAVLRDGLLLAFIFVVPTFALLWKMSSVLLLMGQSPEVVVLAQSYLHGLAWGLLPDFVALILLQFLIGLGHARISMIFSLLWVPVTIFFNYVLMFGKYGLPKLGIAGIGWGMTFSFWITTIALMIYLLLNKSYKKYFDAEVMFARPVYLIELLQIGMPMGAMYCLEVGFFLILTLLMGLAGSQALAANQIALQYLSLVAAVVFSVAQAVTVRMGHKLGENNFDQAETAAYAGIFVSVTFMMIVSLCYWILPETLIALDFNVHDPMNVQIVHYAKQFLAVCAFFQLFEAVRITLFGSLRAFKDTHFTLLTSVISFWCIALPVGYFLSRTELASAGLWLGLVIGAACGTVLLVFRFHLKIKKHRK